MIFSFFWAQELCLKQGWLISWYSLVSSPTFSKVLKMGKMVFLSILPNFNKLTYAQPLFLLNYHISYQEYGLHLISNRNYLVLLDLIHYEDVPVDLLPAGLLFAH